MRDGGGAGGDLQRIASGVEDGGLGRGRTARSATDEWHESVGTHAEQNISGGGRSEGDDSAGESADLWIAGGDDQRVLRAVGVGRSAGGAGGAVGQRNVVGGAGFRRNGDGASAATAERNRLLSADGSVDGCGGRAVH